MDNCAANNQRGVEAKKTADILMDNGWETFVIPAIITSDQESQFVGQWFQTMCSRLVIRLAYSQAYRPQANGRAEVAGKTLIAILRKYAVELKQNWVEMLPRILKAYHDTPGESGFSPFQIVFGRERFVAGPPFPCDRECEDTQQFCDRVEELEKTVAYILSEQIEKEVHGQIKSVEFLNPTSPVSG